MTLLSRIVCSSISSGNKGGSGDEGHQQHQHHQQHEHHILDMLKKDVHTYKKRQRDILVSKVRDEMRKQALLDEYMKKRRKALKQAAVLSKQALDDMERLANARAHITFHVILADILFDLDCLLDDIHALRAKNEQAMEIDPLELEYFPVEPSTFLVTQMETTLRICAGLVALQCVVAGLLLTHVFSP